MRNLLKESYCWWCNNKLNITYSNSFYGKFVCYNHNSHEIIYEGGYYTDIHNEDDSIFSVRWITLLEKHKKQTISITLLDSSQPYKSQSIAFYFLNYPHDNPFYHNDGYKITYQPIAKSYQVFDMIVFL